MRTASIGSNPLLRASRITVDSDKNQWVGFGNSACEIAIDLFEQEAIVSMCVRSPVNVIPRDLLGIPILELSILMSHLSPRIADTISAPLTRLLFGDVAKLGLKKMPYGPFEEIKRDGNIPVLDIGTMKHIRKGHIKIYGNIDRIEGETVHFADGMNEDFDALVAAIGYHQNYPQIIDVSKSGCEDLKVSSISKNILVKMVCTPTGQIHEIAPDAQKIAKDIVKKEA